MKISIELTVFFCYYFNKRNLLFKIIEVTVRVVYLIIVLLFIANPLSASPLSINSQERTTGCLIAQSSLPLLDKSDLEKYSKPTKRQRDPALKQNIKEDEQAIPLDTDNLRYFSYFKTIKRKINRVQNYPEEAKSNFLKGTSVVQFTILKDGSVEDVSIVKSSGFDIFDKNAIQTIKRAAPFDPFPRRIDVSKLAIIADLEYYPNIANSGGEDAPVGLGIPLGKFK